MLGIPKFFATFVFVFRLDSVAPSQTRSEIVSSNPTFERIRSSDVVRHAMDHVVQAYPTLCDRDEMAD
jgi:hypothetical protein